MSKTPQEKTNALYQILSKRLPNVREKFPLVNYECLFDYFFAFYDANISPDKNHKDKSVGAFNKLYEECVSELKQLRITRHDFTIIKTIGKGHFGEVHVVQEKSTDKTYAMKVLKKAATMAQDNMAFFFEERDIMAFAAGEWVTCLHYSFHDHENLYLVMEFLPGGDLLQLLTKHDEAFSDEKTCQFYLSEIIIATNAIHKIGYVHRDIKPENILLDMTGHVKLADFGSAARVKAGNVFSKMPVGTPEYIAPEVLTSMDAGGGKYGSSCDYWSIGIVAYEMIYGCVPFEADGILQLYSKIMNHKESLVFDEEVTLSEQAKGMIRGLITDKDSRLTYQQLMGHDFFKSLDWTTIRDLKPPFVPDVKSGADTSNFDDMKTVANVVQKSALGMKDGIPLANSLPFIGYTFTRSLHQRLMNDVSLYSKKSTVEDSISANQELSLQKTLNRPPTQDCELKEKLKEKNLELKTSSTKLLKSEAENKIYLEELEKQRANLNQLKTENKELLDKLKNEGGDASSVLAPVLNLFGISTTSATAAMTEELKNKYDTLVRLKNDAISKAEALEKELQIVQDKFEKLVATQKEDDKSYQKTYDELKSTISNLQQMLEKNSAESQAQLHTCKANIVELEKRIVMLEELNRQIKLEAESVKKDQQVAGSSTNLDERLNILVNKNHLLTEELDSVKGGSDKLQNQLTLSQKENYDKSVENETLKINMMKLQQSLSEATLEMNNFKMKIERNVNLENEVSTLKKEFSIKESKLLEEKTALEKKLANMQNEINAQKAETLSNKGKENSNKQEYSDNSMDNIQLLSQLETFKQLLANEEKEKSKLDASNNKLLDTISAQKQSNYAMAAQLEELHAELISKGELLEELANEYDTYKNLKIEDDLRFTETFRQQAKLIEFLQNDQTGGNKKKKAKKSKKGEEIAGKMMPTISITPGDRDLKIQLDMERANIMKLNMELDKLRKELDASKSIKSSNSFHISKTPGSTLSLSQNNRKNSRDSDQGRSKSSEEGHNIRLIHFTNNVVCIVCFTAINYGSEVSHCVECNLVCHSSCESSIIYHCKKNYSWFPSNITIKHMKEFTRLKKNFDFPCGGWIRTPNISQTAKNEWDSRYIILKKTELLFFTQEVALSAGSTDSSFIEEFNLNEPGFSLHPSLSSNEMLAFANASNIQPFWALQLPEKYANSVKKIKDKKAKMFFSSETLEDKLYWLGMFGQVFYSPHELVETPFMHSIGSIVSTEIPYINCSMLLCDNIIIYGSPIGLGYVNVAHKTANFNPVNISGLKEVHEMHLIKDAIILIHGEDRHLLKIDTKVIQDKTKSNSTFTLQAEKYHILAKYNNCHLVRYGKIENEKYLLVASLSKLLIFLVAGNNFKFVNEVDLDSFIRGVDILNDCIIVSGKSVFSVRPKTGEIMGFLNKNDFTLAYFLFGSATIPNSLLSFNILAGKGKTTEILLCYSEAGVVVNSEGTRVSTEDFYWPDVPLKFQFCENILYMASLDHVYIMEVNDSTNKIITGIIAVRMNSCSLFGLFTDSVFVSAVGKDDSLFFYAISRGEDLGHKKSGVTTGNKNKKSSYFQKKK